MIWYQAAILRGCTAVIFRRWDPAEFIAATERHGISSVFLVPVQVRDLLRSPAFDRKRLASLTNIGVGGRADAARPDRGVPGSAAALRLHRSLRPVRDRPAHDPETGGHEDARRHRRPAGGGGGAPDRGRGRESGPPGDGRRAGDPRALPDGGLLRGRGRDGPLLPRTAGAGRAISRGRTRTATSRWSAGPARSSSRAASTSIPPRSRRRSRATRRSRTARSSASPTNAGARPRSPTWSAQPKSRRKTSSPTARNASPATSAPARSSSWTRSPAPPPARSKNPTSATRT